MPLEKLETFGWKRANSWKLALCAGTVGIPKGLEDNISCWKGAFGWKLALHAGTVGILLTF